ncbi:heterokaryon incompatibility protein-domain-containing protein [Paraphoma chrysanthemicola]|uniref:Heterokaryon incompatibility protein-domain-containing protein n=1 Tax=Paraphoma chrysanthemicola TaxID=798071 RepID=A0A8K0QU38_9PLEO|nr:heterokaryon incompatibility protein-domain-containing protein [Paraphoma chrysanthemicola]
MRCQYCDDLTIDQLLDIQKAHMNDEYYLFKDFPDLSYEHHPSFQSLVESSKEGCDICQAIVDAIVTDRKCFAEIIERLTHNLDTSVGIHLDLNNKESELPEMQVFDRLLIKIGFEAEQSDGSLDNDKAINQAIQHTDNGDENVLEHSDSNSSMEDYHIPMWPGTRTVLLSLTRPQICSPRLSDLRVGEPYLGHGLHSYELSTISQEWLRTCVADHDDQSCPPLQERPLPTRLIDIGSIDGSECPKLIVTSGEQGLYTALSHRWGDEMPLKTTMDSLQQHCNRLAINLIPKTFLDAMTITRELGFRYLWIDSLCILQDSRIDWEQQSTVMGEIYKNAVVVIAAAASRDSLEGIFDTLEERPRYYGALKLYPDSPPHETLQVSTYKGEETMMDPMFRYPLARRGWALQERVLAQRILHYGKRRIYWQCRTAHISADGNPPDDWAVLNSSMGALLSLPRSMESTNKVSQIKTINTLWLRVVESYCKYRVLTFATDKLPAVAGIARTIQQLTGDTYLAGIWKEDFTKGLLWQTWEYTSKVEHRAPSWSWAKWDGYIAFEMTHYTTIENENLAELVHHDVQISGSNAFGEVSFGLLHIRAWATTITVKEIHQLGDIHLDDYPMNPYHNQIEKVVASLANTVYTVIMIGLFHGHTRHEVPLDIWKRGMLLVRPADSNPGTRFERAGAVFHRVDMHGEFDMSRWKREEITII